MLVHPKVWWWACCAALLVACFSPQGHHQRVCCAQALVGKSKWQLLCIMMGVAPKVNTPAGQTSRGSFRCSAAQVLCSALAWAYKPAQIVFRHEVSLEGMWISFVTFLRVE